MSKFAGMRTARVAQTRPAAEELVAPENIAASKLGGRDGEPGSSHAGAGAGDQPASADGRGFRRSDAQIRKASFRRTVNVFTREHVLM
jgi:hypothetical protein